MYKMHVIDIFAVFPIRKKIVLPNIAKIKRSQITDGLQYFIVLGYYKGYLPFV